MFLKTHALHFLYKGENAHLLSEYKSALLSAKAKITRIFDPLSTPINYAPLSTESLYAGVRSAIQKRTGNVINARLVSGAVIRLALHLISMRSKEPGRLYSFLGSK